MTAEVAVLNSHGVALAADSAVTLGQNATKIYTSADKLFQLHQSDPVGIMIYGNATILGMPWEIVIKAFRSKLKNASFDTLSGYADRFVDFLQTSPSLFSAVREERHVEVLAACLLTNMRDELKQKIDSESARSNGVSDNDLAKFCDEIFRKRLAIIKKQDALANIEAGSKAKIKKKYGASVKAAQKQILGNLPMKKGAQALLTDIVAEMLTHHYFGPLQGGIVLAGFGKDQYLPELKAYQIEEFVLGRPRISKEKSVAISDDNAGAIVPFAQQEMVHAFMEGVDKDLMKYIVSSVNELFRGAIKAITDHVRQQNRELASSLETKVNQVQSAALTKLVENWEGKKAGFWQPVLQIVAALPKDELGAMAEALVNLTKFRRRVTTMRETVGGPIDVAVISKGDGFVWLKRKHYFLPELNPRVIARYGRE